MKNIQIKSALILLIITLFGCGKNDDDGSSNLAPEAFELIGVTNGAIEVGLFPTFSWNDAIDPENDEISYSLIIDSEMQPTTIAETNISGNSVTISNRLKLFTTYYWKIRATDTFGNTTESETFSFTTRNIGISSTPLVENAGFSARENHNTIVFENELYVIHGDDGFLFTDLNDVWTSYDGQNWTLKNNNTVFEGRSSPSTIVFDDELWLIGGQSGLVIYDSDVWRSSNGSNWSLVTSAAPFTGRSGHSSVVFNDKIWVVGGGYPLNNDVWSSSDGINWALETASAQFSTRLYHSLVVFDNKMWVIGGLLSNTDYATDVWSSTDGVNWVESSNNAPFSTNSKSTSVVLDDKLWVFGPGSIGGSNNLWHTTDGNNWTLAVENVPFSSRSGYTSTVFNNKIFIIGGYDFTGHKNDVWVFE
ncbi:hypothetical protein [Sediminibacter sp. Hel_I_10]|uniref:hypothetical protein n=1 Tax=Sediminibacter sp. Hel_I_10 TaxID=1392490 RepID=UPI00047BD821|nr:hypothetical protein [Sediminibacter sp. Hel_I_10]